MPRFDIPLNCAVPGTEGNIMIIVARLQKVLRRHKIPESFIHDATSKIFAVDSYTAQLGIIAKIVHFNGGQFDGLK